MDADVIVVGTGLAGLVAATELADSKRKVILLEQEPEASLGGQAFWSFGGLMLVNSPEQRRLGIRDSRELALQDWLGSADFDRNEDKWPRRWAEAYVDFAAGEKRAWLHAQGVRWFPIVGWAERGGYLATGHGNSVPRFHITWGTGPGILEPFVRRAREAEKQGLITFKFRHRVTGLSASGGKIDGVQGEILEPSNVARAVASSRKIVGNFALRAQIIIVTSGGAAGTARVAVDAKRAEGIKVGLVKLRLFRPFPRKRLAEALKGKKAIGVIDRSVGFGWNCGPMYMEIRALTPEIGIVPMLSYIDGLANLDITVPHIKRVIDETHAAARGKPYQEVTWIPLEE